MNRRPVEDGSTAYGHASDRSRFVDSKRRQRRTVFGHLTHEGAFDLIQGYVTRATQPRRILDSGVQDRLQPWSDRLMALRTSAVAACCSKASLRALVTSA